MLCSEYVAASDDAFSGPFPPRMKFEVNRQQLVSTLMQMMLTAAALEDLPTAPDIESSAQSLISSVIDCDEVMHTRIDLGGTSTSVRVGTTLAEDPRMTEVLGQVGHTHPAILSYLSPGDDGSPRRVSDVASNRTWLASPAYREVFREHGARFQLSLVTRLKGSVGTGWVLTRSSRDFSDSDVTTASLLLPQLTAMAALAAARPAPVQQRSSALTSREREVLALLATGAPAAAIARRLGITEATARKHLSHIYAKFGVHDRLSATVAASRLGLTADTTTLSTGSALPQPD
jgi:DNA-binding CsgD family transcriptional regulator